jgi:hypothetical protein
LRIGYPLSESVAPPGTAWGAEGLRGNVANENNLMVLAPAQARKGQSGSLFAQEDMACQVFGFSDFDFRLSGLGLRQEKSAPLLRSASLPCAAYCVTLRVMV